MAIHSSQQEQTREAILELLFTVKYCLEFEKKASDKFWNTPGCLGYSAFILLCTIIDTIGATFRSSDVEIPFGEEREKIAARGKKHFYILNHPDYFDLNLKKGTIEDLYATYRNKVVHNSSLPKGNFLINDKGSRECFHLNEEYKVVKVNLWGLYSITNRAAERYLYYLENGKLSEFHRLADELEKEEKQITTLDKLGINITEASGFGITEEQQKKLMEFWYPEIGGFKFPEEDVTED